ncbi:agmatine deiminase family protein [Adhaeribacter soli]|uniref:Agmatine deiminase family protein n=2 Tax=Adhaeribacter soli TaxID=2607655 RepID=A0A5N1IU91_9BACT|nr:agmatine deiminase family protein [Adhaeribacter soli]
MITDNQTNFLYLPDSLPKKYTDFFHQLKQLCFKLNISFGLLPQTKDIWARDYMPIQIEQNKFVQFTYNPDYLQSKKWLRTISDVDAICNSIGVKPLKSDIKIDGGNIVRSTNKVILSDKIFIENPEIPEKQLIKAIRKILEVEQVIFIPTHPQDKIGHADGMVRFLDEKTVLINDLSREKPDFQLTFRMALHNAGLECIEIPYNPYRNRKYIQANGIYINYLQMKDSIILPIFEMNEDDLVINQFENMFSGTTIAAIKSNDIANEGGILNCITWNVFKEM